MIEIIVTPCRDVDKWEYVVYFRINGKMGGRPAFKSSRQWAERSQATHLARTLKKKLENEGALDVKVTKADVTTKWYKAREKKKRMKKVAQKKLNAKKTKKQFGYEIVAA